MLTDIEIAQQTKLIPIDQLAHEYGLSDDQFIPYGRDKATTSGMIFIFLMLLLSVFR